MTCLPTRDLTLIVLASVVLAKELKERNISSSDLDPSMEVTTSNTSSDKKTGPSSNSNALS